MNLACIDVPKFSSFLCLRARALCLRHDKDIIPNLYITESVLILGELHIICDLQKEIEQY